MKNTNKNIFLFIFGITLLLGVGLTLFGLWQQKWPDVLPVNSWNVARGPIYFMVSCSIAIILFLWLTRKSVALIVIILGITLAFLTNNIGPLLAISLYAIASLSLGNIVLKLLKISDDSVNDVHHILIGTGVYASLVSIMVHFPINYPWVYYVILLMPVFYKKKWLLERVKYFITILNKERSPIVKEIPNIALGALGLLYFSFAFLPELAHDALAAHLFVPTQVMWKHIWEFNPTLYVWTLMPMLGDWNYCIVYLIGGETAARLINIGFLYLILCLSDDLVLWAAGDSKEGASWGKLFFTAIGVTFLEITSLNVDLIWSCYLLAGLLWLLRACSSENKYCATGIILSALMLGLAAAAKAVTLIYLPVFGLLILYSFLYRSKNVLKSSFIKGMSLFVLVGSIPYARAYKISKNPFFPFYNNYFKSPFYPTEKFDNPLYHSIVTWDLPYKIVFNTQKYIEGSMGAAGFQWLTLLISAILLICFFKKIRLIVLLSIALLSLVILFYFQSYLRYALPIIFILNIIIGMSIVLSMQFNKILSIFMIIISVGTLGLNLLFLSAAAWGYRDIPMMMIFNPRTRDQLLLARAPIRKAIELVNLLNNQHTPVAFISFTHAAGINADALYLGWYNTTFANDISSVSTPEDLARIFKKYGITYIIYDTFIYESCWKHPEKRALIEGLTNSIADFSTISVRVLKNEYK